jgi:hypothetical protein
MAKPVEFRFEIKAYTPERMPLSRLARYLDNLATILGETKSVHLLCIDQGSAVPVLAVEWESLPKVKKRMNDVRNNEGPAEARKARDAIESDLAADNAEYGDLVDQHGARVLRFPGAQRAVAQEFGPSRSQARWTGFRSLSAEKTIQFQFMSILSMRAPGHSDAFSA